jgi:signal transduction histidine kinase
MKLVNELLLIEKLESGVMAVEQTVTDFSTVLGSALEAVRELAESRQVKVLNQTSNAEIYVDPDRLTQVLINLLSNAIKYSEPGQSVSIQETNTEEWFEIRVSDEGRGIPATAKEKIFQRFQQVELGDSKRKGGTGLGLAICKAIIEQHNGSIGVDSELGRGSTFWFRIPAVGKVIELKPESEKVAMLSERKEI